MKDRANQTQQDSASTQNIVDIALLLFILIVGLGSSIFGFRTLQTAQRLQTHETISNVTRTVVQAFDAKLAAAISAVRYGGLMIEINPDITNLEFQTYAQRASEKTTSVRVLEWQPIITAAELTQFETKARAQAMPNYRVVQPHSSGDGWVPVSGRDTYVPVLYAWPVKTGTAGIDMSFSSIRMESKLKSAQSGTPVASGVFDLMQSGKVSTGEMAFAISQAVFDLPKTPQDNQQDNPLGARVKGYLAAVIPIAPLFENASSLANAAKFDLTVFDVSANDGNLIYSSIKTPDDHVSQKAAINASDDVIKTLEVASRSWKLVLKPRSAFLSDFSRYFAYAILLIGIALTTLLTFAIAKIQRGRKSLEMASALLEKRVQERTQELSAALENLTTAHTELVRLEKASVLGSMVSGIGHELNTPIGNSLTVASTLKDHVHHVATQLEQGMSRRQMNEFVEQAITGTDILVRSLQKAADLISSFKQVAIDQESEARRSFFLHTAIAEVLLLLTPAMRHSHVTIHCDIADDLRMDSYPGAIYQIVTNLVNNCVLHAFDAQQEGRITIRAKRHGDQQVKLEVIDNGKGIPEKDLKRVFDPFFTTKRGQGGSGLGLNIVFNLVKKTLGGDLTLTSTPQHGTCISMVFHVTTP
jgi:signal transduction histidine kinase